MSNQLGLAQVRRVIMSLSMEHNLIAIVFFHRVNPENVIKRHTSRMLNRWIRYASF